MPHLATYGYEYAVGAGTLRGAGFPYLEIKNLGFLVSWFQRFLVAILAQASLTRAILYLASFSCRSFEPCRQRLSHRRQPSSQTAKKGKRSWRTSRRPRDRRLRKQRRRTKLKKQVKNSTDQRVPLQHRMSPEQFATRATI